MASLEGNLEGAPGPRSFPLLSERIKSSLGAARFGEDGRGPGRGPAWPPLAPHRGPPPPELSRSRGTQLDTPHRVYLPEKPLWTWGRSDLLPIRVLAAQLRSDDQARGRLPPSNGVVPEAGLGRCRLAHTGSGDAPLPAWGAAPRSPGDAPAILRPLGPVPRAARPRLLQRPPVSLQSPVSLLLCLSALSGPETEVSSSAILYIKAFCASSKKQMSRLFPPPPLRHTQQEPPGGADRFSPLPAVQCLGVARTWWPEALHAGPRGLGGPSAPAQPEPSSPGLLWDRVTPRWR